MEDKISCLGMLSKASRDVDDQHCTLSRVLPMALTGLQSLWLVAALAIVVEIGASLLLVLDREAWFGAGALGVSALLTIPLVHHFRMMEGGAAVSARLESEEHLTVIGGLMILSIASRVRKRWKVGMTGHPRQGNSFDLGGSLVPRK